MRAEPAYQLNPKIRPVYPPAEVPSRGAWPGSPEGAEEEERIPVACGQLEPRGKAGAGAQFTPQITRQKSHSASPGAEGRGSWELHSQSFRLRKVTQCVTLKHLAQKWGGQGDKQAWGRVMDSASAVGDPGAVRLLGGKVHSPELARDPETLVPRMVSVLRTGLLVLFLESGRKRGFRTSARDLAQVVLAECEPLCEASSLWVPTDTPPPSLAAWRSAVYSSPASMNFPAGIRWVCH